MGNMCGQETRNLEDPKESEEHNYVKVEGAVREVRSKFGVTKFQTYKCSITGKEIVKEEQE